MKRADREQAARRHQLDELMAHLRRAREREEEWYMWVLNGKPVLTEAEYARVGTQRSGRGVRR